MCRYWTRKESVLKATGDGLMVPMTSVGVTDPGIAPAVTSYGGRPLDAQMCDLAPARGYAGAVTLLTASEARFGVSDGAPLLARTEARRARSRSL